MKKSGDSVDSEKMKRAELLYRRRRAGLDMPDGHYTKDVFQLSSKEWQPCCRNIMIGDEVEASHNTTPDVGDLQRTLCRMADAGCDYVVMEVSSHALALNRVAGIEYDTAALTNITQDHLDFHKTMENYREAKALLFTHLHEGRKKGKTAIFNMDDASSPLIMNRVKTKVMTYGKARTNDVYPIRFHVGAKHMELSLHTPEGNMDLRLHITGEFNVYNVMTAVCAALAEGLKHDDIVRGLDNFAGVPGRFQLIELMVPPGDSTPTLRRVSQGIRALRARAASGA